MSPCKSLNRLFVCFTTKHGLLKRQSKETELKRRFEDGLSNMDMSHYLRLHAGDCDFAATMLKARQYTDAAESTRPKKIVKIFAKPTREIQTEADDENVTENPN